MKRLFLTAALLTACIFTARADDPAVRLTLSTVAGVASHTVTEADTGIDRIALVQGGLLTLTNAATVTGTVELVSGLVTNQPDTVEFDEAQYASYAPATYWYVQVGDIVRVRMNPTNEQVTAWIWLD